MKTLANVVLKAALHFLRGEVGSVGSLIIYFQLLKRERISQHVRGTSHGHMVMQLSNLHFQESYLLIIIENTVIKKSCLLKEKIANSIIIASHHID